MEKEKGVAVAWQELSHFHSAHPSLVSTGGRAQGWVVGSGQFWELGFPRG